MTNNGSSYRSKMFRAACARFSPGLYTPKTMEKSNASFKPRYARMSLRGPIKTPISRLGLPEGNYLAF